MAYMLSFDMSLPRIILDTNVLIAAFISQGGASRAVLRRLLLKQAHAVVSLPLFNEYCDVLSREALLKKCLLNKTQIDQLFDAFLSCSSMVEIYYAWRPNLKDEGDNHVFELAIAASDAALLTYNLRDFMQPQLKFPHMQILTPAQWLQAQPPASVKANKERK